MEAMIVFIFGAVVFLSFYFIIKGSFIILSENFILGLLILLILTPVFVIWALYKGLTDD
jgi:hypothetical protein